MGTEEGIKGRVTMLEFRDKQHDTTFKDHEMRIRSMESTMWKAVGALALANLVIAGLAVMAVWFHK